jgi:hypothetical protein
MRGLRCVKAAAPFDGVNFRTILGLFLDSLAVPAKAPFSLDLCSPYGFVALSLPRAISIGIRSPRQWPVLTRRRRSEGEKIPRNASLDGLFLIPFALAVAFLLWVLWSLAKQIKR